jgi:hypothetical protein
MQQDPSEEKRRAQLIDRTLRGLPSRRAPPTLEWRVLAEIERRASRVWWRRSFSSWPVPARAGFVVLSLGLIVLTLAGSEWTATVFAPWGDAGAALAVPVHRTVGFLTTMQDLGRLMTRLIPVDWIYGGASIAIALYGGLFGLGTVAYRVLYLKSGKGG